MEDIITLRTEGIGLSILHPRTWIRWNTKESHPGLSGLTKRWSVGERTRPDGTSINEGDYSRGERGVDEGRRIVVSQWLVRDSTDRDTLLAVLEELPGFKDHRSTVHYEINITITEVPIETQSL